MKPINTRGQGRSPLPATLGPPEDGANHPSRRYLITEQKPRSKPALPPLAWAAGWARKPDEPEPGEHLLRQAERAALDQVLSFRCQFAYETAAE